MATVLQTDYAWPDDSIERTVIEAAGHLFVSGPSVAANAEAIEQLVKDHDPQAIMTCWAEISERAIAYATDLQIVQRIGVGLDNIAVAAATASGAWVANVPDYCADEVSAHAVAFLLDWARGVTAFDRQVKLGHWDPSVAILRRVSDLTVGIIGVGRIGRTTAERLMGFGCSVITNSRSGREPSHRELGDLLSQSDVVIVHAPLTDETYHLIDAGRIAAMKEGAFLINVSRGPLVDTHALIAALEIGKLSGAGLDVVEGEPAPPAALVSRADVLLTPHIAFSSAASLNELRRRAAEEVVRVLAGEPPHFPCNNPRSLS